MSKLSKCVSDCSTEQMVPISPPLPGSPSFLRYNSMEFSQLITLQCSLSFQVKGSVCLCVYVCVRVRVHAHTQLCPALCNPMDCSPPGSSVHGIFQARILEWVAISFSGDVPDLGIEPGSPTLQAEALPSELPGKPRTQHNW